jgi:hypothetical protein
MKKHLIIMLSALFTLSLCGCGATETPLQSAAAASPGPSATESPGPTATESAEATPGINGETKVFGLFPDLSIEQAQELEAESVKRISAFLDSGYDPNDPDLLRVANNGEAYGGLGLVSKGKSSFFGEVVDCQSYLLGGCVRDGYFCVFAGSENIDNKRVVFPVYFSDGLIYFDKDPDSDGLFLSTSTDWLGGLGDSVSFYDFVTEHMGDAVVVTLRCGPAVSLDFALENIWDGTTLSEDEYRVHYGRMVGGVNTAATICQFLYRMNESSDGLVNWVPRNENLLDINDVPMIDETTGEDDLLFYSFGTDSFASGNVICVPKE